MKDIAASCAPDNPPAPTTIFPPVPDEPAVPVQPVIVKVVPAHPTALLFEKVMV